LNGICLMMWNNLIYTLPILNIVLSAFTLVPFYYFVKREFNGHGAMIAAIFLAIDPILFRNSFMALSETPYLFFLVLSLNFLSKAIRENSNVYTMLAGLGMCVASGFRYESGIIALIILALLLLRKHWKQGILFAVFAFIFLLVWAVQSGMQKAMHWQVFSGRAKP
jgi:4-amino-4-deoxy-L-arabinose transferase-like glycosyltransferase